MLWVLQDEMYEDDQWQWIYVALWMYLIPLNCILSNGQDGKFAYVYWSQFKKWKNQLKMDCKLNCKNLKL